MQKNKKNIALFIENYIAGGSDKIASELINNLEYNNMVIFVNKNNDLSMLLSAGIPPNCQLITYDIWTLAEYGKFANQYKNISKVLYIVIKIFNIIIRYPLMAFYILYFYFLFKRFNIDIFFSNNGGYPGGECNRMATIAASFFTSKNYHIIHNLATEPFFKLFKYFEYGIDYLICKCSKIICVSDETKKFLVQKRYIPNSPLVIYNGVLSSSNQSKKIPHSSIIKVLNIGALGHRKNQLMIIEALRILKSQGLSNIELYLVGQEEEHGYIDMLVSKLQEYALSEQVFFENFQKDPYKYYKMCDIFVLSSIVESFALVRVEAMSIGMPIITTNVGDACKQVKNGINGFIVDSPEEIASALNKYMMNDFLIEEHAKNGYIIYRSNFTRDKMIEQYQALIDKD